MFPRFQQTVGILLLCIVAAFLARVFGEPLLDRLVKIMMSLRARADQISVGPGIDFASKYYLYINIGVLVFAIVALIAMRVYRNNIRIALSRISAKSILKIILSVPVVYIYGKIYQHIKYPYNYYVILPLIGIVFFGVLIKWYLAKTAADSTANGGAQSGTTGGAPTA